MKLQCMERDGKTVQYYLTLPKKLVEAKGWKKGADLQVRFGPKGEVILEELKAS